AHPALRRVDGDLADRAPVRAGTRARAGAAVACRVRGRPGVPAQPDRQRLPRHDRARSLQRRVTRLLRRALSFECTQMRIHAACGGHAVGGRRAERGGDGGRPLVRSGRSSTRCTSLAAMRFTGTHPFRRIRQATAAPAARCGSRRTCRTGTRTARRFTSTSAALATTLALAGCRAEKPVAYVDVTSQVHGVQFVRLERERFRSQAKLDRYLERAAPGRHLVIPKIDFAHREAILVAMGPRSSTGYALDVVKVVETSGGITITVRERTPSLGEPVVARVTYPFVLLTIPRIHKSLHLHLQGRP